MAARQCCVSSVSRRFQTCCKLMFQVFQLFHMYVSIVSCGCCKSRSGCCICCNGYTLMLQTFFPISHLFFRCKCVYLDVAYVSLICCRCFYLDVAYVLQWFSSVSCVFFASVLDACFKRFICVHTYIASVESRCCICCTSYTHML